MSQALLRGRRIHGIIERPTDRGTMALYFSSHVIACLTQPDLRELMNLPASETEVKVRRSVASQLGGRMIVETEAPDQKTLEAFFAKQCLNCEWVMRLDLDAEGGKIEEY
jgi:hypothetical protein